ncbi:MULTISPECIES: mitochondrial fission ELM1 family protein [Phenylobacterium]|uniref:Mitochondrial fission protein ELM1 n=1 Tax=Phenylobacterium koreense TaxID=266125 RepID=A0ABV2EE49_9CAUL
MPKSASPVGTPLTIWAVSDGRAGIEAQALGLAQAVARQRPASVEIKHVAWKGELGRLPWRLMPFPRLLLKSGGEIAPPWPDIWIATGRATLPLSIRVKAWSRGRTFVVQTQDPRIPARRFDLVIPPRHDRLEGENVFPITGSPGRVTPERLAAELERFSAELEPLPHPRVAVIIGGKSKAHDLSTERAEAMAREIETAVRAAGGSVMVSFTRRTPPEAEAVMAARLKTLPGQVWNGQGDNPYFAYLAAADYILATEDSTNLATDAASTGKPVLVLAMEGESRKLRLFHDDLQRLGAARRFEGVLQDWSYEPLAETDRAASEILRRYDIRQRG